MIVTQSEFEALVLECSQIKQHKPKYNILLKDDKGYSYVKVTREAYPRISAALQKDDDNADYIGPYTSSFAVREMVETRMRCVPPAALQQAIPAGYRQRASLPERAHRQMHGRVQRTKSREEDYNEAVESAVHMIRHGQGGDPASCCAQRMEDASRARWISNVPRSSGIRSPPLKR